MKKEEYEYITWDGFELAGDTDDSECRSHVHQLMISTLPSYHQFYYYEAASHLR
jgi:hypothetical protein